MRVSRYLSIAAAVLATQCLLGCQHEDSEDNQTPQGVDVPASLDHPAELVGKWQEAKGKQTIDLKADGTCEMLNKISMGPAGATSSSEQKISSKWGTKDDKFYFTDINNSLPLAYDWKVQGGKLSLSTSGSKLAYTQIKEEKK